MEKVTIASFDVDVAVNLGINAAIIDYVIREKMQETGDREVAITGAEFQEKTTLSRAQQQKAIAILVESGFLVVTLKGRPATNHFQFKMPYQETKNIIINSTMAI